MTNSSISLPRTRVMPATMAAVASSALPKAFIALGLRKAWIRPISLCAPVVGSTMLMFSVSMECPKR
ncbi:hypothetical protein D3C80_1913710 [compost metagenome]